MGYCGVMKYALSLVLTALFALGFLAAGCASHSEQESRPPHRNDVATYGGAPASVGGSAALPTAITFTAAGP